MYEYLEDKDFLYKLDSQKIKKQYVKLIVLDFTTEYPIEEIQGVATTGSISVNGNSLVRRTLSLTLRVDDSMNDLTNVENLISIKTKIKVFVGIEKMFKDYSQYGDIGTIIWFKQGVFILSSASLTRNTSGMTISILGKDKMVLLDGTVGGTLPASTTFNEIYNYDAAGNLTITYPTIYLIILESVEHIGGQPADRIIITDVDEQCKLLVKYIGSSPLYFNEDYSAMYIGTNSSVTGSWGNKHVFLSGDDVGYKLTDFTYPSELTLNAGDSVVTLLNKIVSTLGNYEFYFDLDGNFIFLEIKNYLNTSYTPIVEIGEESYVKNFSDSKYQFTLTDANTVTAFLNSPNYSNVKNDFIVWGTKETYDSDNEIEIRYHLAVDVKPEISLAAQYLYSYSATNEYGEAYTAYGCADRGNIPSGATTLAGPCSEWREELYRLALLASNTGTTDLWYGEELISEWRNLYDPSNSAWASTTYQGVTYPNWNPDVFNAPDELTYWLDFIDTDDAIALYSVNMIGRRTKATKDDDAKTVYNTEVPDVVFISNPDSADERIKVINNLGLGQKYCLLNTNQEDYFTESSTPKSCFDEIRALVYLYLTYNTSITVTCLPKYYLEPNQLIYVEDTKSGIAGDFVITSFTVPLAYNGTMSLVASEALTRV